MAATALWARSELRGRWRSALVLALLVGLGVGTVLASVAGARRTDSAFDRLLESTNAADLRVQYGTDEDIDGEVLRRLESDPRVEVAVPIFFTVGFSEASEYDIGVVHSPDDAFLRDVDRLALRSGRLPAPGAAEEIVAGEFLADDMGLDVGGFVTLITFSPEQLAAEEFDQEPAGPVIDLEVVGIGRTPDNLADEESALLYAGSAYYHRYGRDAGGFGPSLNIALHDGADGDAVVSDALHGFTFVEAVEVETTARRTELVQDAVRVLATGLLLFGACAALATAVATGQALSRRISAVGVDQTALQAVGVTRLQRVAGVLLVVVPAVVGGAVLGVLAAVAASPLLPMGVAGRAEPSPGIDVDFTVLGLGGLATVVLLLAVSVVSAWRQTRVGGAAAGAQMDTGRTRRSAGAATAARAGWSPSAVLGISMALEPGRGRTAVPVRPALAGAIAGIAGIVGALTFGASLDRTVSTPAEYGWNWAISPDLYAGEAEQVAQLSEVRDVGMLLFRQVSVEGRQMEGVSVVPVKGSPSLTIVDGRMPSTPTEVALGPKTAEVLGRGIGDEITVQWADGERKATVVGEVLFPTMDENLFSAGLAFHPDLADVGISEGFGASMVGFEPGVTDEEGIAAVRELLPESLSVYAYPSQPGDVANLAQVRGVPVALAAFLVFVALAAVGHALATSVRRRRRDIGIVRSLGFSRGDVRSSVVVQSTTLVVIGLVVGVPVGIAVGRTAWALVADGIGLATRPTIPVLTVSILVLAALVAAAVLALLPARAAGRLQTADVLRAE